MNDAIYQLQIALGSMGHDPGKPDGYYGPRTHAAAESLAIYGPGNATEYAQNLLRKALRGLGWLTGPDVGEYSVDVEAALLQLLEHGGLPKAEAIIGGDDSVLTPTKPLLRPIEHDRKMYQVTSKGRYLIDTIMLHCLAVPGDWHKGKTNAAIVDAVRRMHKRRGWRDIGYTEVACPDGRVLPGRPWDEVPAGAIGYNRGVWHIVMVETKTITKMGHKEDYFTPATIKAVKDRIEWICQRTQIKRLMGHNESARKLCPGFKLMDSEWTDRAVT